jgi:hypothetical protein
MTGLVAIGVVASLLMGWAALNIVRPVLGLRVPWPALAGTVLAVAVTTSVGSALGVGTLDYFVGVSLGTLPVLVFLLATADGSGADTIARWTLVLAWAVVIFPAAVIVPPLISSRCTALECTIEDFGGALALLISSGSLVLLAWLPAGVAPGRQLERGTWTSVGGPVLLLWLGFVFWLAHLEGAIDEYIPRIVIAAVLAPIAGAAGWLLVDLLRASGQHPGRSLVFGVLAGMVAIVPGAVTVSFPWSLLVGVLAGAVGALVHGARGVVAAGVATRWALTIMVATAVGYFAPPVSGDTIGFLFSASIGGFVPPATAFVAVALLSLLASAPLWILLRRHATKVHGDTSI